MHNVKLIKYKLFSLIVAAKSNNKFLRGDYICRMSGIGLTLIDLV